MQLCFFASPDVVRVETSDGRRGSTEVSLADLLFKFADAAELLVAAFEQFIRRDRGQYFEITDDCGFEV